MNKKTILLIIFLFLVAVAIGFVLQQLVSQPKVPIQKPVPTQIIEPLLLPSPKVENVPAYTFSQRPNSFPATTRTYSVLENNPDTIINVLAKSLGFSGEPKSHPETVGGVKIWSSGNSILISSGKPTNISYSTNTTSSQPVTTSVETLNLKALEFLRPLGLLFSKYEYRLSQTQYFNPTNGEPNEVQSGKTGAVVQLNYQAYINNLPVYFGDTQNPTVWVRFDSNNAIIAFAETLLPDAVDGKSETQIITVDGAAEKLQTKNGVLLGLEVQSPNAQPYLFQSGPKSSSINNIELAYYYVPGQMTLHPIFVFRGIGEQDGQSVQTISVVSALP